MKYEVKLDKFAGPLQLLLELVEQKEMEITEVSLSSVTEDYLNFVNRGEVSVDDLADFLSVAARLLYLKSRALLPELEVPDEEASLAAQLKMYKEFVEAAKVIDAIWLSGREMRARERVRVEVKPAFSPPVGVTAEVLRGAFQGIVRRLEPFILIREAAVRKIVTVQERIRELARRIEKSAALTFNQAVSGAQSRADIAVSFLALLEMIKQNIVQTMQSGLFGEITIKKFD